MADPLRVVAMICLTVIVVAAEAGLTVAAVFTDRDLLNAERFTFFLGVTVAAIGGLSIAGLRGRHRWRVEREDINGHGEPPR